MRTASLVVPPTGRALGRAPVVLAANVLTIAGFTLLGGTVGLLAGMGVLLTLVVAGPLLAFAVGTVLSLGVADTGSLPALVTLAALGGFPVGATREALGWRPAALVAVAFVAVGASYVLLEAVLADLTAVTGAIVIVLAGVSYLLHRFELVTLGLVEEVVDE